MASFVVDIGEFLGSIMLLRFITETYRIVIARICSSSFYYIINQMVVFLGKCKEKDNGFLILRTLHQQGICASAFLVTVSHGFS